jgi:hypothetical protein
LPGSRLCQHLYFYLIYLQPHIYTPVCCVHKTIAKSDHQLHHVCPSACLSVCPYAWIWVNSTRQIFTNKFQHFPIFEKCTKVTGALH